MPLESAPNATPYNTHVPGLFIYMVWHVNIQVTYEHDGQSLTLNVKSFIKHPC